MANVRIYADIGNIMRENKYRCIQKSSEYITAYELIQKAIYNNEHLDLVVKNKYCLNCLEKMKNIYGEEYIDICTYSPKKELEELFKVDIPEYIEESDILKIDILNNYQDFQINTGTSFEDMIIYNYLTPHLATDKFPFKNLFNIANNINFVSFNKNLEIGLVNKVYVNKIGKWKKIILDESELNILNKFISKPEEVYKDLSKFILLLNYPEEISERIVGNISKDYRKINISGTIVLNEDIDILDVKDNIRIFLNSLKKDNLDSKEIWDIMKITSGALIEEFNFIVEIFKSNISVIDHDMIQHVKNKFYSVINSNYEYYEVLDNIIPPSKPKEPDQSYTVEKWLDWAKHEYLNYRFWMEENNRVDDLVDEYSDSFGSWMYSNYNYLIAEREHMIFNTINSINQSLKTDELSILLVVDNFNYKYVPLIKELFKSEDFSNTLDKPVLSMLPSETSISKVCLFRGDAYNFENSKSYDKLCSEWQSILNRTVKYVSGIGELRTEQTRTADVYIVNYIEIDSILHRNQKAFAQSTSSKVKEELKALVQVISSFVKRIGYENKVKIYLCSDHGCTKIIKDKENYINKSYYKGKCEDASHRFIIVPDESMSKLSSNIEDFCYVLDRNNYGIKYNYLIAKSYYRFLETNENFYVHGGITPEETIIPFLKFERVNIDVKYPIISIKQKEFRNAVKTNITFEISNANEYDINQVDIDILNSNIKGSKKNACIDSVDKLGTINIDFNDLRITKNSKIGDIIIVKIGFTLLDRQYEKVYEIPIIVKSMMENKMDLDDLF